MNIYILIIISATFGYISFRLWNKERVKKKQQKKRFKRGLKLEQKAAKYLMAKGFSIIGDQLEYEHNYYVNKEEFTSKINIDYLVERQGEVFVVEVKSGKSAISIKNRGTRRQLLEYAVAIECDGLYLLDMENKDLKLIEFTFPNRTIKRTSNNGSILSLFCIILVLFYVIYRLLY